MADLTALRRAHATRFARAVRREVVLVHVALTLGGVDGVEALPLVQHAERNDGERLSLAALEQARTVHTGQVTRHDIERTNLLRRAAVGALAGGDNHGAHSLLLKLLQRRRDVALPGGALFVGELLGLDAVLERFDFAHARELVGIVQGLGHLALKGEHALGNDRVGGMDGPLDRLDVRALEEAGLSLAERSDSLLAKRHSGEHILFGNLVGAGLDHGDVVGRTGDGQLKVGVLRFLERRVHDELARLGVTADAHAGGRAIKGSRTQHEGSACAHDADGVGRIDAVNHERRAHDVHLALEAVGEAGTDGAVHHAGRERALVGGACLALEVAAGNATDGVHLLDEVDRQGEEVIVLLLADNGRYENGRVALGDNDGAGGLLGQLARFEAVLLAVKFEGFDNFFHACLLSLHLGALVRSSFFGDAAPVRIASSRSALALPTASTQKPAEAGSRC